MRLVLILFAAAMIAVIGLAGLISRYPKPPDGVGMTSREYMLTIIQKEKYLEVIEFEEGDFRDHYFSGGWLRGENGNIFRFRIDIYKDRDGWRLDKFVYMWVPKKYLKEPLGQDGKELDGYKAIKE